MMRHIFSVLLAAVAVMVLPGASLAEAPLPAADVPREQVSFQTGSVHGFAMNPYSSRLVMAVEDDGFRRLVKTRIGAIELPQELTAMPAGFDSPTLSLGSKVAYVSDERDAKGDIYLLDPSSDTGPVRLTDERTADADPSFAPDDTIYFSMTLPGENRAQLARVGPDREPYVVLEGIDAVEPSVSSSGEQVAFVSFGKDPGGDILILDLAELTVRPLVEGPYAERQPSWTDAGEILFTRIGKGGAEIWRVNSDGSGLEQLTVAGRGAEHPFERSAVLYFLADTPAGANVFELPYTGEVRQADSAGAQLAVARTAAATVPRDDELTVAALRKVITGYPSTPEASQAAFDLGMLLERMDRPAEAARAYAEVAGPLAGEAGARKEYLAAASELASGTAGLMRQLSRETNALRSGHPGAVGDYLAARLLERFGREASTLRKAMRLAGDAAVDEKARKGLRAEAALLEAGLAVRFGAAPEETFVSVVRRFDGTAPALAAANRLLDEFEHTQGGGVERLTLLAQRYGDDLPVLAASAQNRAGDLLLVKGETPGAKAAYAHVLSEYPDTGRPTAAARLALAELYYREGRFAKAVELYENAMTGRAREDGVYRLARKAYLDKTASAGERLLRNGEIPAARSLFAELVRTEPEYVPGHRGWIRASLALGKLEEAIARYYRLHAEDPGSAATLYSLGLAVSYRDDERALTEARKMIRQSIAIGGQGSAYYRTLGFIEEALENAFGRRGGLERALSYYEKAWFLAENERDRAALALNLGNVNLRLGRSLAAYRFYLERLESGVPFESADTELLFYRHLGMAAFRADDPGRTVDVFNKALDLVRERTRPLAPSVAFGLLSEAVRARALRPAVEDPALADRADDLARRQAEVDRELAEAGRAVTGPPPSEAWTAYRNTVAELLEREHDIMNAAAEMMGDPAVRQTFDYLYAEAQRALDEPVQLAEAEAELLNRLALAQQDDGRYSEAAASFREAAELARRLKAEKNLGMLTRSAAYNVYMQAGEHTGTERERLLTESATLFREARTLVLKHGVPDRSRKSSALISIDIETSLDEATASRASGGFSAAQEVRLCDTFLARIALETGRIGEAASYYAPQIAAVGPDVPRRDVFEASVLLHRGALMDNAMADPQQAFDRFARSAELAVEAGSRPGAMVNLVNMAHCLNALPVDTERLDRLHELSRRAAPLVRLAFPKEEAECRNTLAAMLMALGERLHDDAEGAVRRSLLLADAGRHLNRAVSRLDAMRTPDRDAFALRAAAELNLARLAGLMGADPKPYFTNALGLSERAFLPRFRWRALAGLDRLDEALEVLAGVPLSGLGCGRGEIVAAFAPLVTSAADSGDVEGAFNLAERIMELERVNRMGPMFHLPPPASEAGFLVRAAPRLLRIRSLMLEAENGDTERLRQLVEQEQEIMLRALGPDAGRLPGIARLAKGEAQRTWLTVLAGLDVALVEAADEAVQSGDETAKARLAALGDSYRSAMRLALEELPVGRSAGALGLFLPRPVDFFEVYLSLPEERSIRLFFPDGEGGVLAFSVHRDMPELKRLDSLPKVFSTDVIPVVPDARSLPEGRAAALSGTQFVRGAWSLKPFRSKLMGIGLEEVPEGYRPLEDNRTEAAQTLAVNRPAAVLDSAPARPGLRARPEPVVMDRGERLPMVRVTRDAASLSSAAFAHLDKDDAYAVAHLFSLYGIPSLYFGDLDTYLTDLPGTSPEEAATAGHLAGHPGLRPDAAAELARQRFKEYVLGGQEAFRDGRFDEALVSFADSLNVIDETPEFERYRPDALKFAREAAYRAGMYDEAADYAGRLAALVEEVQPGSTHHADALLSYGVIEAAAGHYGKAVPLLQKATQMLAEAGGMLDEAEALAELGVVLENSLKYRDALGTFREAAEVADLAGADSLLARQYSDMGRVLDLRLDDYVQARKEYARALEIHRAMGDSRGAAQALLDIGRCHRLLGDIQGASEHYAEALELADDDALKARIVLEQATNAWYGADYQRAFNLLGDVLAEARASDDTLLESLGLNASGMTWWTLGDTDRALRDLDESLELARTVKNREDVVASVLNNKGLVLRESGRFDEALQALNEALAMDRRSGSRWGQAYALRNIARTRLDMGDADGAWPLLSEALALTREIGNRINEAKILALTGQVALTREGPDEAAPYFDDALRVAAEVGLPEVRWRAMHGLGLVARERGDLAGAEDAFRQAVDIIESLRAGVAMQELRDGFAVGRMQPYEDLVRVLADLDRPEAAFAVAERSRARSLVEMLGNGKRRMRDELSTELFNGLTDLKGRINEQQALIKRADTDEEREVYGATLQSLRDRYRDMLLRARAANPELAGIVEAEPLDIPAVRELLDPGTSLLVYYLLDDEVLCWTVSRDSAALFRTSADRAELERLVLDYRRGLQNLEPVDVVARRLHGLLLGGVDVPEGTIGIVPHGILHHLSFATLDDGEKYFVDDHPLFRVPSASVMAYTFARRGKATGPVLVAADPDVGVPALELPFARREGRSVAFNFVDARLLLGGEASKPEVVQAMETSRMVHIAAHGEFNRENPLMSTVKLAPADGDSGDLLASDVFGINAPADLVVLSACQTGLSGVSDGDDVVGLNRAFLFAGTHVLGASLWRVSDVASAILMKSFYRNLDTVDKSEALRRAMVHVRNRYPHPGYWGAFTLTGDHR